MPSHLCDERAVVYGSVIGHAFGGRAVAQLRALCAISTIYLIERSVRVVVIVFGWEGSRRCAGCVCVCVVLLRLLLFVVFSFSIQQVSMKLAHVVGSSTLRPRMVPCTSCSSVPDVLLRSWPVFRGTEKTVRYVMYVYVRIV